MSKSDYKLKDLLDIESRFHEYLINIRNDKDGKSFKNVFIIEKDIFNAFAFVGEYWEIDIAGGTKSAKIDELETVLINVKDEISKRS